MATTNSFFQRWEPVFLSILRIMVGLLFLEHGTQKFFHFPPPDHPMGGGAGGLPPMMMVAGAVELIGGLLLVLGLFTRLAAFIACGEMAVAYFMVHAPGSVYPVKNHGSWRSRFALSFSIWRWRAAGTGPSSGSGNVEPVLRVRSRAAPRVRSPLAVTARFPPCRRGHSMVKVLSS